MCRRPHQARDWQLCGPTPHQASLPASYSSANKSDHASQHSVERTATGRLGPQRSTLFL